jgi:sensor c-di-GMP phosphodiesterase-like protein
MEVTAEGVETPSALALLRVMGCDLVQGYLLACPMPLADLIAFLADDQRLAHLPAESHNVLKPASYWERAAAPR